MNSIEPLDVYGWNGFACSMKGFNMKGFNMKGFNMKRVIANNKGFIKSLVVVTGVVLLVLYSGWSLPFLSLPSLPSPSFSSLPPLSFPPNAPDVCPYAASSTVASTCDALPQNLPFAAPSVVSNPALVSSAPQYPGEIEEMSSMYLQAVLFYRFPTRTLP